MINLNALPGQKDFEKIAFSLRQHWFIFSKMVLLYAVLTLIPIIVYYLFVNLGAGEFLTTPPIKHIVVLTASIYYLCIWLFFFVAFIDYYLDIWIVTNDRIVSIEQKGMFNRTVAGLKLYRIQDITAESKGLFPTMLNYGNVFVQTAGEQDRFVFKNVPNPYSVSKRILELSEADRKHHLAEAITEKL